MIIIGLAGGIGSGKSTTAAYLRSLGIPVFNAAGAAKSVAVNKGSDSLQTIAQLLGPESILPNGELNRPWVAEKVFRDRELMQHFEAILQEQVWNDLQHLLAIQKSLGAKFVFLDLPLMIERGLYKICNSIWLIAVPDEIRIQRAILRDRHLGKESVIERNRTQLPLSELKKYANVIIDNSGAFENTKVQINELLKKL
jgi:dephospho-CoA kinase